MSSSSRWATVVSSATQCCPWTAAATVVLLLNWIRALRCGRLLWIVVERPSPSLFENLEVGAVGTPVGHTGVLEDLLGDLVEAADGGGNEAEEGARGVEDTAGVLGVVLNTDVVGVVLDLDNLHTLARVVLADEDEARLLELVDVIGVDLITVTVTLLDGCGLAVESTELAELGTGLEMSSTGAETHGATKLLLGTLGHEDDDAVLGVGVELLGSGILEVAEVAGGLDDGNLHTKADTEEGGLLLTSPLGSANHTLGTTVTEAARDENTLGDANVVPSLVVLGGILLLGLLLEVLRINPDEVELTAAAHGGVLESLDDGKISVVKLNVLADQDDVDGLGVTQRNNLLPPGPDLLATADTGGRELDVVELQGLLKFPEQTLLLKEKRNLVDGGHITNGKDLVDLDLAAGSDLVDGALLKGLLTTARNLSMG